MCIDYTCHLYWGLKYPWVLVFAKKEKKSEHVNFAVSFLLLDLNFLNKRNRENKG